MRELKTIHYKGFIINETDTLLERHTVFGVRYSNVYTIDSPSEIPSYVAWEIKGNFTSINECKIAINAAINRLKEEKEND